MTFLEKLKEEHPEKVGNRYMDGVDGCPHHYGYEKKDDSPCKNQSLLCLECWNREMPKPENITVEAAKTVFEWVKSMRGQNQEQVEDNTCIDPIKLGSEAYRLIGRVEGMTYRLLEPEFQNSLQSLQDDINALTKIIDTLVEYAREETK